MDPSVAVMAVERFEVHLALIHVHGHGRKGQTTPSPEPPDWTIPGPSQQPRNQQHAFFQMRSEGVDHQGLSSATGTTKHQHQT